MVDKKSLKKYKEETGDYRKKLKKAVDFRNETFRQDNNKRCAFLKDNNLCDMYLNLGPDSLCKTCRMYPRHVEEFENVREITLSVSCPEVARILLSKKEPQISQTAPLYLLQNIFHQNSAFLGVLG